MIELDAEVLAEEIRIAEERIRKHIAPVQKIVNELVGPYFGGREGDTTRENHWYEWLATNLPLYYMNAPKVKGTSTVRGDVRIRAEAVARAVTEGVNESIERTDFDSEALYCANDFALSLAAMIVTLEDCVVHIPQPPDEVHPMGWSMPVPTMRPRADRIPPARVIMDPLAIVAHKARWIGHIAEYDPDALRDKAKSEQSDGWDSTAIEEATRDALDDLPERENIGALPQRREIVAYDLWIRHARPDPNLGPDEGYNGAICTVAKNDGGSGAGIFLRKPTPYKGPPCGPYVLGGGYAVMDSPWFLAPLIAVAPQVDELNVQADVISGGMQSYKRGFAVDSTQADLSEQWSNDENNGVLLVTGLAEGKAIQLIETGGVSAEMFQTHQFLLDRLERASGHSQNRSGRTTGSTASEASIVQANVSVRTEYLAKRFAKFIRQVVWVMGWQYFHNELILYTPTGDENSPFIDEATGMPIPNPVLQGGAMGDDGFTFDQIRLTLEPYSMERVDQSMMQQNWLSMMELVTTTAPTMPQTPWVDWKRAYEKGGDALNDPEFGDIIKYDVLQSLTGMMMTANQGAPLTQGQPGQTQGLPGQLQGAMTAQSRVPQSAHQNGKAAV